MTADLVPACACCADVGTDHGYLIAELVESGRCVRGIAADLRQGPLDSARRTLESCGLSDRVALALSDGTDSLPAESIDSFVFAGMGGELIAELVLRDRRLRQPGKTLICQPMTRAGRMRSALCAAGYEIVRESACREGQRLYQAAQVVWSGTPRTLTAAEALVGRLPYRDNPDAEALLRAEIGRLGKIASLCTDPFRAEEARRLAAELSDICGFGA